LESARNVKGLEPTPWCAAFELQSEEFDSRYLEVADLIGEIFRIAFRLDLQNKFAAAG
jgi:hypothetical protein